MNDFTKDELEVIQWEINTAINKLNMASLSCDKHSALIKKVQSMIDNYRDHNAKWIAKAHLTEAESLIHHAKCLLGMDSDE